VSKIETLFLSRVVCTKQEKSATSKQNKKNMSSIMSIVSISDNAPTDWLVRVANGKNFWNSSKYNMWGVKGTWNIKKGDRMWFITSNSKGHAIAVATFMHQNDRSFGPLVNLSMTDEELGWEGGDWDKEIHYEKLYDISHLNLQTKIKGVCSRRKYNEYCLINLPEEYPLIVRYSKVQRIQ